VELQTPVSNISCLSRGLTLSAIGSRSRANGRGGTPDDDDPPTWMEGYVDPLSWMHGYAEPPSSRRGYSDPSSGAGRPEAPPTSRDLTQAPAWVLPHPTAANDRRTYPGRPQQQRVQTAPSTFNPHTLTNHVRTTQLHTKQLPTLKMFLDQALVLSNCGVSPWEKPVDWVCAESEYINSIIQDIATLTGNREIMQATFTDQFIIYPVSICDLDGLGTCLYDCLQRLVVYVFAHFMLCHRDKRYHSYILSHCVG
jgi:hypothetical protein